jgi:SAM-dependent methyltransferase
MANDLLEFVREKLEVYERKYSPTPEEVRRMYFDALRLAKSLKWLSACEFNNKEVLELGGFEAASFIIREYFKENNYHLTHTDLRQDFPFSDLKFDFILNMEVVEHIFDLDPGHRTYFSGLRHCLKECFRVLRRGGEMFMTTPNASSAHVIRRALFQQPPWLYEHHFREYTPEEISHYLKEAGFRILEMSTETVWHQEDYDAVMDLIREHNYPPEHRGDDIFVLTRRP